MPADPTLDQLRRYAVARTLFTPTTLPAAIRRLGFVQADPIRAPARAQDLTLRHRVRDYRAGDLESRYARLPVEEDCLVNYGFLPREHLALMHPRDDMHYRGLLRVRRRDGGTRIYEAVTHPPADDSPAGRARRAAALIELIVRKYAPLPAASLTYLVRLLGYGAPHLAAQTQAALALAREQLA